MDDIHGSIYWCILQVSLVVGIGVSVSLVFARRYPAAACSMTYATVVMAALLTAVAPLPVHRYFMLATSRLEAQPEIAPITPHSPVDTALPANVDPLDHSAFLKLSGDSLSQPYGLWLRRSILAGNLAIKRRFGLQSGVGSP